MNFFMYLIIYCLDPDPEYSPPSARGGARRDGMTRCQLHYESQLRSFVFRNNLNTNLTFKFNYYENI